MLDIFSGKVVLLIKYFLDLTICKVLSEVTKKVSLLLLVHDFTVEIIKINLIDNTWDCVGKVR